MNWSNFGVAVKKSLSKLRTGVLLIIAITFGQADAEILPEPPTPQGGDLTGSWKAEKIAMRAYVPAALVAAVKAKYSGELNGTLMFGSDGTVQADYTTLSTIEGVLLVPIKVDVPDTSRYQGNYTIASDTHALVITPENEEPLHYNYTVTADSLQIMRPLLLEELLASLPESVRGLAMGALSQHVPPDDPIRIIISFAKVQPAPVLGVQEKVVNFGTVEVAQSVQQTIRVSNTGTVPLEVTGIESDVSGLTFEPSVFTVAPNGSQTVTVGFPSSTVGEFSGRISILSNDPERAKYTLSFSVIVQPPPVPVLSVQETAVNFGTVEVAQMVQQTIRVVNTGTAVLEVRGIESDVSGLTFGPSAFTLEPSGSQVVAVRLSNPTVGEFSGSISILSNDPERAKYTLSFSVVVRAVPVPMLEVQETAVNFGTVEVAQAVQQTIRVSNTGTAVLEVTGIESDVSGLTFEPSAFTLEPNGSQMVTITLPNPMEGEFSGSISILSNDPERAKHTLSISVIVQPAPVPVLGVQEVAVNFGTVKVTQMVQQTIQVVNTGTVPLEVTGIESDVSGLTFEPSVFTVAPNDSQMVTVRFPSSTVGEFSGSINILSNDPERAKHTLSFSVIVEPLSLEAKSDFDGNGVIEFADFLLFVGAFGSSESQYDIDGNGVVDFPDFLMFVQVFGKTVNG